MKKEELRMAKKKEYRSLKISSIWNYGSNPAPQLRLQGRWLEELGFQIGEAVLVKIRGRKAYHHAGYYESRDGEQGERIP